MPKTFALYTQLFIDFTLFDFINFTYFIDIIDIIDFIHVKDFIGFT